jgi:hypothetical protein
VTPETEGYKRANRRLASSFEKLSYVQKHERVQTHNSRVEKKLKEFETMKSVLLKLAIGMFLYSLNLP